LGVAVGVDTLGGGKEVGENLRMSDPFTNLLEKTGKTMPEWLEVVEETGLEKHGEIVAFLKSEHGMTHGFANGIALQYRARKDSVEDIDLVAVQYEGAKAGLRPIYDTLIDAATAFGPDVAIAPKKTSVALRRHQLFAVITAASAKRLQLGVQLKGESVTDRLVAGDGMCSHRVNLTSISDVDAELLGWLREAYDRN